MPPKSALDHNVVDEFSGPTPHLNYRDYRIYEGSAKTGDQENLDEVMG